MKKVKTFFLEALRPLGVELVDEGAPDYGVEMSLATFRFAFPDK